MSALQLPALLVITILAVNAFWLLPHLYFLTDAAKHVPLAQSNLLFSERAFLMNKFRGTIADVAILRGPLFDWLEFDGDQFVYLLSEWRTYFQDSFVLVIGYLLFCLTLVGFGISIIKKDRIGLAILPAFLLSFVFLLNMNPPLEIIFSLLREKITIFREALRFPYTKFSLLYLFGAAYYFAIGNKLILTKFKKTLYTQALYTITLSLFFVFYMLPVFFGFLIDPEIKIRFPESYFNLFRWFKQQPQGERIAVLPIHSMWGWEYYDFGYQGAGFIWFGLNQPVLVRDFDRWSSKNENFYWESMQITHRGDLPQLEKLLEKYQVGWLILDEKIINPYAPKTLNINNLENLLSKSSKISLVKNFENIKVYKIDLNSNPTESIFLTSNLPLVYPIYSWNNYDRAYNDLGTYQSTPNSQLPIPNFYYPFRPLFTGRRQEELEFSLDEDESYLKFVSLLPTNLTGSTLFIPPLKKEEISEIDEQNSAHELKKYPSLFLDGELLPTSFEGENKENIISLSYIKQGKLEVVQPKIRGYFSYDSNKEGNLFSLTEHTCDQFTRGKYSLDTLEENNQRFLRLSSSDSSICIDVTIPYLSNELGYLLTIEHRHISGQPLQFSLINTNSQMSILQTHLPQKGHKSYYIVPPSQEDATGYALHFENLSIGREPTVNDIARITIHPIPYDLLTKIRIVNTQTGNTEAAAMTDFPVVKALSSNAYLVTLAAGKPMIHQTLVLSQSFDAGWKAYEISNDQLSMINYQFLTQWFPFIFGKEIKEHVLINNWANGWDVTSLKCKSTKCEIVIIYLPQYLEYIGLVVTILTLGVVIYAWRPWGWITSSRLTRSSN